MAIVLVKRFHCSYFKDVTGLTKRHSDYSFDDIPFGHVESSESPAVTRTNQRFAFKSKACAAAAAFQRLAYRCKWITLSKYTKGSGDPARGYAAQPFCSHAILKKLSYTSPFCGFNQRVMGGCSGASPALSPSPSCFAFVLCLTGSQVRLLAQFFFLTVLSWVCAVWSCEVVAILFSVLPHNGNF